MAWIDDVTAHVAQTCGLDPAAIALEPGDADVLLDLAAVAAHRSGDRTNAPLLCHVLGRARAAGVPLDVLEAAVREFATR
jgi:hypothetical protein